MLSSWGKHNIAIELISSILCIGNSRKKIIWVSWYLLKWDSPSILDFESILQTSGIGGYHLTRSSVPISASILCKHKPPFPVIAGTLQDCLISALKEVSQGGCAAACPCPMTVSLRVEAKEKYSWSRQRNRETFHEPSWKGHWIFHTLFLP